MSKNKNKIAGAVYGFAIGDTMGATTEFMTRKQIKETYGIVEDIVGGGWLQLEAGQVTDDTQMMMCVMEALQESIEVGTGVGYFHELCGAYFVAWLDSGPKDVGNQCRAGIEFYKKYGTQKEMPSNALGNGGLMRALPCALIDKYDLNLVQNSFTHHNDICMSAIRVYHSSIQWALRTDNITQDEIDRAFGKVLSHQPPTGFVTNTLDNVRWWCSHTTNFADIVIEAVNDGGDADTIGALVGGLAGAMYGYDSIPTKWIEKLNPKIKKYLDEFINFCCQI